MQAGDYRSVAAPRVCTALCMLLVASYPLLFGPACRVISTEGVDADCSTTVWRAFRPIAWLGVHGPPTVQRAIREYAALWYASDPDALGVRLWFTPFELEESFAARRSGGL
jgi:hypothetical protein